MYNIRKERKRAKLKSVLLNVVLQWCCVHYIIKEACNPCLYNIVVNIQTANVGILSTLLAIMHFSNAAIS